MPSFEERQRRKDILKSVKGAERERVRDGLPMPPEQMRALFDFVDERLSEDGCDHSLRFTRAFLQRHHIAPEPVVAWLENAGGHCDCEVIFNAEEEFESAFPSQP